MKQSNLALVLIRGKVNDETYLLLAYDREFGGWSLVRGIVGQHDPSRGFVAAFECNKKFAPMRYGKDFILLPQFSDLMSWVSVSSEPTDEEHTTFTAQVFVLTLLGPADKFFGQLRSEEFRLVPESTYATGLTNPQGKISVISRALEASSQFPMSWDESIRGAELPAALFAKFC